MSAETGPEPDSGAPREAWTVGGVVAAIALMVGTLGLDGLPFFVLAFVSEPFATFSDGNLRMAAGLTLALFAAQIAICSIHAWRRRGRRVSSER